MFILYFIHYLFALSTLSTLMPDSNTRTYHQSTGAWTQGTLRNKIANPSLTQTISRSMTGITIFLHRVTKAIATTQAVI